MDKQRPKIFANYPRPPRQVADAKTTRALARRTQGQYAAAYRFNLQAAALRQFRCGQPMGPYIER
jgi:hypothetical protein